MKIGVTSAKNFDFNSAFCDHPFGWAYYGILVNNLRFGTVKTCLKCNWSRLWKKI